MPFQTCWRCLSRLPIRNAPFCSKSPQHTVTFTTSASLGRTSAPPKKVMQDRRFLARGNSGPPKRGSRNFRLTKTKRAKDTGKRPLPGERKAMRKRVVLSNSNALEVKGMQDITAELAVDARLQGKVIGIPGPLIDRLRAADAFKPTQGWSFFRRPGTLIRKETVQYGKLFDEMSKDGEKRSLRRVLIGERGSGKTVMLLQAMTMAFLKDWVVINLPEGTPPYSRYAFYFLENPLKTSPPNKSLGQDIVIGHTEYAPLPQSSPTLYAQRSYVAKLLSSISRANPILETITLSSAPEPSTSSPFPIPIPPSISLSRLALLGSQDVESAHPIFDLLIQELSLPGRPRLLICIDGLAHVMTDSAYRTPAFEPLHAHQLAIVNWFMGYLSGASPLPNGGMVLAATSQSNAPNVPTLNIALTELEESQSGVSPPRAGPSSISQPYGPPLRNPFTRHDERVLSVFESKPQGLDVQRLAGITKEEARGLLEYYAQSGILRQRVSDGLVAEKWSVSGGGVVGELERASIRMEI